MAYEKQTFIDYPNEGYTTLKAEHLNHIEDGIANALTPEKEGIVAFSRNILLNEPDYWLPEWSGSDNASKQGFMNGDTVSELSQVVPISPHSDLNYICSPMIRLDTTFDNVLVLGGGTAFIRHMYVYNAKGETLFACGYPSLCEVFTGGITQSDFNKFIADETNKSLYPNICASCTYNNYHLNSDTLKELNTCFLNNKGTGSRTVGAYVEGEPVWFFFNSRTTTRPSMEEEYPSWVLNNIKRITLTASDNKKFYTLPPLGISQSIAKKYYKYPFIDSVMEELGEFKKALAIKNQVLHTTTTSIVYSETMTEDFLPEKYFGYYLPGGGVRITDFEAPTYSSVTAYENYKISRPIPLDLSEENTYIISGYLRHFHLFDKDGISLYYNQHINGAKITAEYVTNLGIDPEAVKWIAISNTATNWAVWKMTHETKSTFYSFEMPSLVLTEEQMGGIDISGIGDGYKTVDLTNVDRIVSIGDSYTESHYTIKDKSWMSKVSLLSDYNYDNFAISGDTYRGQLNKIRKGTYAYASSTGMTWEKLHPTHTIMISKTNDTKYMDCQQFIYDMIAAIETTKGLGAIPIIASEYHVSSQNYTQTAFDYYAKKYGGYYIDLTEKVYTLRGAKDYGPFWGGSHPGTRTNHIFCDVITDYINKNLPRPYSSIKIFRPRDNSLISNLDNYIFGTIEERAEKFKEISICHSALKDASLYDNCTDKSNGKVESEYFKLISGASVEFDKMCLIDVILPTTVHDISEVKLITNTMNGVNCYVKDVLAEPYPSPTFCRRFDIASILDSTQVAVGNKYTSDKSTGTTYTVLEILYDKVESSQGFVDGTILICSGNRTTSAYNNSTLTLTSGTGNSTLSCTYEAVGLSSDYPAGKQDIGHYVLLSDYGVVNGSVLKRAVDCDKITFLLVSDSTFNLRNVEIKFKGNITKTRTSPTYNNTLSSSYYNNQTSLIAHSTFDSSNIAYWLKNNQKACGLTPTTVVDGVLPKNISQIVTLKPEHGTILQSFTTTVAGNTYNTNHKVKVWARYFPDIFDATTMTYPDDAPINDNSFDWAKLNIQLYDSSSSVTKNATVKMPKLVGLHWTEVEVDITLPPIATTWYIGLSVEDKPIQLAKCVVV